MIVVVVVRFLVVLEIVVIVVVEILGVVEFASFVRVVAAGFFVVVTGRLPEDEPVGPEGRYEP